MIDRLFFAALGLAITMVLASALATSVRGIATDLQSGTPQVVQLERVVIVGKRVPADAALVRADAVAPAVQRLQ